MEEGIALEADSNNQNVVNLLFIAHPCFDGGVEHITLLLHVHTLNLNEELFELRILKLLAVGPAKLVGISI